MQGKQVFLEWTETSGAELVDVVTAGPSVCTRALAQWLVLVSRCQPVFFLMQPGLGALPVPPAFSPVALIFALTLD